ncbi:MAG: 4-hydroxythreonine-4-phosphate dehydrogenase PdxA [Candidatus Omnitrophota bacterium]|nr:4-hydroxythreonine-4-phosphate dehydrogenase PdxA [Candidatus Omnitrophota bacterium]
MSAKKIIITMGDPSGIGPEVTVKALSKGDIGKQNNFIIVGDVFVLSKIKGFKKLIGKIEMIDLKNVNHKDFSFGKTSVEYGKASLEYIDKALDLINDEGIKALVTGPVNKEAVALYKSGFSGQTGYLAEKTGSRKSAMLLTNDKMILALVTQHIPLREVAGQISVDKICEVIELTSVFLKKLYRIKNPHIAVSGLNPHASDSGLIGDEEENKIIPAIREMQGKIKCSGPYPADTLLSLALNNRFDAVVVMYHDQALIPLKLTGKESGVNITLGLPFIRTSPLHGTAFDIASKFKADPSSMISAIKTAQRLLLSLQ